MSSSGNAEQERVSSLSQSYKKVQWPSEVNIRQNLLFKPKKIVFLCPLEAILKMLTAWQTKTPERFSSDLQHSFEAATQTIS